MHTLAPSASIRISLKYGLILAVSMKAAITRFPTPLMPMRARLSWIPTTQPLPSGCNCYAMPKRMADRYLRPLDLKTYIQPRMQTRLYMRQVSAAHLCYFNLPIIDHCSELIREDLPGDLSSTSFAGREQP